MAGAKLQPWNPAGPEKAGRAREACSAVAAQWAGARLGWGSLGGKICLGVVGLPNWGLETLETPGTLPAALLPRIVWAAQGSPKFEGGKLEPRLRELAGGLPGSCSTFALHVEMPVAGCRREPECVDADASRQTRPVDVCQMQGPLCIPIGRMARTWRRDEPVGRCSSKFKLMVQTRASRTQQTVPVAATLYPTPALAAIWDR